MSSTAKQADLWTILRMPRFRNVWLGAAISQLGDVCFLIAVPWLVLQMTGSGLVLGSLAMAVAIPRSILLLFGGAVSDRLPPSLILIVGNLVQAVSVAIVAILAWNKMLALWELYLIGFCFGVADAFCSPAVNVLVPDLVPKDNLQAANSLLQGTGQICLLFGAGAAGLLVDKFGTIPALVIDSISFLFLVVALLGIPIKRHASATGSGILSGMLDGLRYVYKNDLLRSLIISMACINFCVNGAIQIGFTALAKFRFNSSADFGALITTASLGALIGTLAAGVWHIKKDLRLMILGACAIMAVLLLVLGLDLPFWSVLSIAGLLGIIAGYTNIFVVSWLQGNIGTNFRGSVMSALVLGSTGLAPISLAVSGLLVQLGFPILFVSAGVTLSLVAIFMALRSPDWSREATVALVDGADRRTP
jgi:Major Facilitator Superfamily